MVNRCSYRGAEYHCKFDEVFYERCFLCIQGQLVDMHSLSLDAMTNLTAGIEELIAESRMI